MILLRLLDHELHRTRQNRDVVPLWIEIPAKPSFLPAIISGSSMDNPAKSFLVSRKLTKDGKIRCGIFKYDADRIDEIIGRMLTAAHFLSKQEKWSNIFGGKGNLPKAFAYIQNNSGVTSQPHICLYPDNKNLSGSKKQNHLSSISKFIENDIYQKCCHMIPCDVPFPIFASRPDFVGMYTQFIGSRSSILLHNIKNGLAFCPFD